MIADSIVMGWTPSAVHWWSKFQEDGIWKEYAPHTQIRRRDGHNSFWLGGGDLALQCTTA